MRDATGPTEVVVYGTVCLDRFVRVDAAGEPIPGSQSPFWPPRPKSDDATERSLELPGGEAFNTATALFGWGVNVLLTGTALGSDPESTRLSALLDDPTVGLPRRIVPQMPSAVTPVCTVSVSPDGERRMSGRGFAQAVAPPPLPDDILSSRPVFAVDPNLGPAAVDAVLRAADFGCPVVAMDFLEPGSVLAAARIVQTSREWLHRSAAFRNDDPPRASLRLLALGAQAAVVTNGAGGCFLATRLPGGTPEVEHIPAFPISPVVDTTGAGDMFRAGLCWGLLPRARPWPLRRTVRFAAAAAALHCRVFGAGSRPRLRSVQRFANSATGIPR